MKVSEIVDPQRDPYTGVTEAGYMPLKNYVLLEGINKSSNIKLPDTITFDAGLFDKLVVVGYGPDIVGRGVNVGDVVFIDPRLGKYGIPIPVFDMTKNKVFKDRYFVEFEFTAIRGLIPRNKEN
ncbi:hypothetical protein KKH23_07145 [Patescibacteria group bacterium]|nr:hypothetical protein [Patescibacteria group bacterium]MBU0846952.1 hypothetical protein [Patescibacteria group bacterium]